MFTLIIYILTAAIGFIMVFLFRQTYTSAQILKPNPEKVYRVFMIVFGIAVVITFALSWFTTYTLQTPDIPLERSMRFQNIKSVMILVLNFSFLIMVILANTYSLTLKKLSVVPYLLIIGFYILFVLKDAYIISDYFLLWQKSLKSLRGGLPDFHSTAWVKCALGTGVTLFNMILIWFGLKK